MTHNDVDFTSSFELHPNANTTSQESTEGKECNRNTVNKCNGKTNDCLWCYGLVIWFDTHFTDRFCKENPVILSTSPYTPKTHWSQTLLTFREPICLSSMKKYEEYIPQGGNVGTANSPATCIKGRISIARSSRHRSIDISLETSAIGVKGVSHQWPVQIFDM